MKALSIFVVCLFFIIFSNIFIDRVFALIADCANSDYAAGDCTGDFYQTPVDCGNNVTGTGDQCCTYWAQQQGVQLSSPACSDACVHPVGNPNSCPINPVSGCFNAPAGCGLPGFCCHYSQPASTPACAGTCGTSNCAVCPDGAYICGTTDTSQCSVNQTPTPTLAPTCSSNNCGVCSPCSSCINQASCGWTGSACQSGTASCPIGAAQWYWDSCSTNVCTTPSPSPPPPPTCNSSATCTYGQACTTSTGAAGTQSCTGVTGANSSNTSGACGYDTSGVCKPNCTTCVATPPTCNSSATCTYGQACTTSTGAAGTQSCTGVTGANSSNTSGACGYDTSGVCKPNCTTCNPPPTGPGPTCTVSWNFSPSTTPTSNTTVTATITGTGQTPADFPWSNVAYNIDSGSWTTSGLSVTSTSPPTYQANFNSGPPGQHNLQFSAHDNSGNLVVCSGTGTIISSTPPQCPVPTGLSPSGTLSCGLKQVTLKWDPMPNATSYDIRVDDGNNAVKSASGPVANNCSGVNYDICINGYQGTSMTINITPGINYSFWVHSFNATCSPPESSATTTTFSSPTCSSSVSGAAFCTSTNDSQIFWQWNQGGATCGTGSYTKLRLSDLTTNQSQDFIPSSDQTSFTSAGLTANHNFTLGVFDNSGGTNPTCLSSPVTSSNCSQASPPPSSTGKCTINPGCSSGSCNWYITTSDGSTSPSVQGSFSDNLNNSQTVSLSCSTSSCSGQTNAYTYSPGTTVTATYSDANHSCSKTYTVGAAQSASCSDHPSRYNLSVYTYNDPGFYVAQWPQYAWDSNQNSNMVCWGGGSSSNDQAYVPTQSNLASLPQDAGQSGKNNSAVLGFNYNSGTCWSVADCAQNVCTNVSCDDAFWPFQKGSCDYTYQSFGTTCGDSPNGGKLYCDGKGVCSDNICQTDKDCSTASACSSGSCSKDSTYGYCFYSSQKYGTVCGSTPSGGNLYCGGNSYTGVGDNICHSTSNPPQLCSGRPNSKDCDDGNPCTQDTCIGADPSNGILGQCSHTNLPPTTICQTDAQGNPQKLCSPGTDPSIPQNAPNYVLPTCSVDYVTCNSVNVSNSSCCGLTNIQGMACRNACNLANFPINSFNQDSNNPLRPYTNPNIQFDTITHPLPGVIIHADSECGSVIQTTDSSGYATLPVIDTVGSSGNLRSIYYRIWAEVPQKYQFTRGTYLSGTSHSSFIPTGIIGPGGSPSFNQKHFVSGVLFGFQQQNDPWVQTTGGDVHSNTIINTPGGP